MELVLYKFINKFRDLSVGGGGGGGIPNLQVCMSTTIFGPFSVFRKLI